MTREEAFTSCPSDSYVEFYGNQWLIIPFEGLYTAFFDCTQDFDRMPDMPPRTDCPSRHQASPGFARNLSPGVVSGGA
jgi:hypothetical protein